MSGFSPGSLTLLLLVALNQSWTVKAVLVAGRNVSVFAGGSATLPCTLSGTTESLTQISWQRTTMRKTDNGNFFTILAGQTLNYAENQFTFIGNFSAYNGTLQLSNATLLDDGIYLCIFTLFPSGSYRAEMSLRVLVPPAVSVKDDLPLLGDAEVSLATCTAAGSRPPAQVRWLFPSLAGVVSSTTTSVLHDNGTTTTVSSLFGVPTRHIYRHGVTCVVTGAALTEAKSLSFMLQVYFSPTVVTITERSENSFECLTEANPAAEFTWNRGDQSWPQSGVTVTGPKLQVVAPTAGVSGLYQCQASNKHGRSHGYLYVLVSSGSCTVCWVLYGLLIVLVVLVAISAAAFYGYRRFQASQSTPERRDEGDPAIEPLHVEETSQ